MGAPTSSIFSKIYLQHIKNSKIVDILLELHIIRYFHYVHDNLIVYKNNTTNIMPMKFTMEVEKDNKIKFLSITTSKEEKNIFFNTYRKPTTTDTIISSDSCHPPEHKFAAIRYLTNRMQTYNLNAKNK
jgi:hypothetical protein